MTRILIIDDDETFRTLLRKMLERKGYEVTCAPDGEEGVALYKKDPTDLVITDLLMPKKEGVETILELKKDYPNVKVIVLSGGGIGKAENYLEIVELLDVERTFSKPLSMEELLQAVEEITV
ncbi:MAG: response regulator [Waddliaceae bacterium]